MISNSTRVISLIPSLTETLIDCGVNVVGRTRFCIHPGETVAKIPKVGGTKDIDWNKVKAVEPDLIIFDKEENTKTMADECDYPYFVIHIQTIDDVALELHRLAEHLQSKQLQTVVSRWQSIASTSSAQDLAIQHMPGIIEWWQKPVTQTQFVYLIWRDPWMAAGSDIFIQSVLDKLGFNASRYPFTEKYPQIDLSEFDQQDTVLLFSSEPYPFANYKNEMKELGYACGLIDGELFSWYGTRSLRFLEEHLS